MKIKRILFLAVVSTAFLLCGCTSGNKVYLENASVEATEQKETEYMTEQIETAETVEETKQEKEVLCYVHLCGAVKHPGIYVLPEGSRIYEAVLLAGGLTEDACEESVNQAEMLSDGQLIKILTEEEMASAIQSGERGSGENDTDVVSDGRINLNTASVSELTTLPGVGESKAEAIIAYREEHNGFASVEEIKNIAGIKDGIFQRIKEKIKVE